MSRKYSQKGYQDDAPRERGGAPRKGGGDRDLRGPRGRGLGGPSEILMRCNACGHKLTFDDEEAVPIGAVCAACGADLHTCSNCRHFEPSATFECRKPVPQRIPKKTKNNTCELYEPKQVQEVGEGRKTDSDVKSAFDALFDF
jgi:hypothetical protein